MGQILVLISLAGCYSIDLGADWLIGTGFLLVIPASLAPSLLERLYGRIWTLVPYVMIAGIVVDFYLSGGDILPPLFRMVLLLTLYRSLQVRTAREDLQVLLLTLFLIIVTGVFSQDLVFGIQLVFYTPVAIGLLFMANLSTEGSTGKPIPVNGPVFQDLGWRSLSRRILERFDRRILVAGMAVFLSTSLLTFLLFIFLPRFDIGAALPFPRLQTNQSLTGFTDHVRYGDVVSILNDDSIAMRVDVQMENPPALPYWRMVVLDAYYNGGFMVSPRVARERVAYTNYVFSFDEFYNPDQVDSSVWTVYMEGGISSYLPVGDFFRRIRFNHRTRLELHRLTRVFKTDGINANTVSVRLEGLTFPGQLPVSPEDLKLLQMDPVLVDTAKPEYLGTVAYPQTLLAIPKGEENSRIMKSVLQAIGYYPEMPVKAFATRLVDYLRADRGYSLDIQFPDGEADTLLRWVESGQAGHCELYAGAFVLISRYAGYPARLVTGFVGGDWNGFENYYMVRNRNAHAWCEVFSPGDGWLRMDPTPGYGLQSDSVENALATGGIRLDRTWQAYLDSLRVLWYRRVIQFDSEDQKVMALTAKEIGTGGLSWLADVLRDVKASLEGDWKLLSIEGKWGHFFSDVSGFLIVVFTAIVIFYWIRKRGRKRNYEQRMRRKAGMVLRADGDKLEKDFPDRHGILLVIRYGAVENWPADVGRHLKYAKTGHGHQK